MNKWQPIETAPHTEDHVLYAHIKGGDVDWAVSGYHDSVFGFMHDGRTQKVFTQQPTHWMPMPTAETP